jgi:hypothetical protein
MSENDRRRMFSPGPVIGDAINLTAADLEGLDVPDLELRRYIEEAAMNAMPRNWEDKAICAGRLLYARLIAGIIPPEEKELTERVLLRLIECGGWTSYKAEIKIIRLVIRGCGFMPGYPLKFKHDAREQDYASARSTA